MKKALLFLLIVGCLFLFACDWLSPSISLSPPNWIIGTWGDGGMGIVSYTFTADNIRSTNSGITVDFKEAFKDGEATEEKTDSLYKVTIVIEGITSIYTFEKTSTTTLGYSITSSGITVGPVELVKE